MSLFEPAVTIRPTDAEYQEIAKPVIGGGGHQRLLESILATWDGQAFRVEPDELRKAEVYAYEYGNGGFQGRFKVLLKAAWRSGWNQPEVMR